MTDSGKTLVDVSPPSSPPSGDAGELAPSEAELAAARELVRQARAHGVALTGPDGLLKALTRTVIETALDEEMSEHLGYDKGDPSGRNRGNSRNGKRSKTVITDNAGAVQVEVPRDRDGTFEPVIVGKRQRRLSDVDAVVLSLYAKGLTTGEITRTSPTCTRRCSSTRSWSRSATGRSGTAPCMPRSGSTSTGTRTSSGCGPVTGTGS